jgi:hypothetical protein
MIFSFVGCWIFIRNTKPDSKRLKKKKKKGEIMAAALIGSFFFH